MKCSLSNPSIITSLLFYKYLAINVVYCVHMVFTGSYALGASRATI